MITCLFSRNKGFKPKVIQEDVSKFLPPGFKVPEESEEQSLSINKIFPRIKPTEATKLKLKTDIPPSLLPPDYPTGQYHDINSGQSHPHCQHHFTTNIILSPQVF